MRTMGIGMFRLRVLTAVAVLSFGAASAPAQSFDVSWCTIDTGGRTGSTGGTFSVSGTMGQPDAGILSGGTITLTGGFWAATLPRPLVGDMNCDGLVNNFDIDGFVLALIDPNGYATAYARCNILNGDVNHDGALNNFDIDAFVNCILLGCS